MMEPGAIADFFQKGLLRRGADEVLVGIGHEDASQLKFANTKIITSMMWDEGVISLFFAWKKRLVATSVKDFSEKKGLVLMDNLLKFARALKPNKDYWGLAEGPFTYPSIERLYDPRVAHLEDKAVDYVAAGMDAAQRAGVKRVAGGREGGTSEVSLFSSHRVAARQKSSFLYFSLRAFWDKGASGHMVTGSRTCAGFDPAFVGRYAAEIARNAQRPKPGIAGRYDVLFEALPFANLLTHVGSAASIFAVESGLSFFGGKLKKRVASPLVTLTDDGRLPNALGSALFDAEGVPTQTTPLITKGVFQHFLHNTSTARRYRTRTTGNAGLVQPEPHNLVLRPGDHSKEELLRKMKKGLYITNTWYTRFQNYHTGDFSTIPRDGIFYVENGKIKHPLQGIRVSENLPRLLRNVAAVG